MITPMQNGRYYMSRIVKLGQLDQDRVAKALLQSVTLNIGKFAWTVTDVASERGSKAAYIFGKLSKFDIEGQVTVVDTQKKRLVEAPEKNLLVSSSPFVYLPEYSGLAYLHVWNEIQEEVSPVTSKPATLSVGWE